MALDEPDSSFIGAASATLAVDEQSNVYIGDVLAGRVLAFASDGTFLQAIGRRGSGPSEWKSVGAFGSTWHDALVFNDSGDRELQLYRGNPKTFVGSVRYSGHLAGLSTVGDSLVISLISRENRRAGDVRAWAELLKSAEERKPIELRGVREPVPTIYSEIPEIEGWTSYGHVPASTASLTAFGATDVLILRTNSSAVDTLKVPACNRRGFPEKIRDRWLRRKPTSRDEAIEIAKHTDSAFSAMMALWPLDQGRVLWWNQDAWLESNGRLLKGRALLTVVDPSTRKACVDVPLEAIGTGRARIGVLADTIFAFDQRFDEADSAKVHAYIDRYVIDDKSCVWRAL